MNIAVIGTGKTGSEVVKLLDDDQIVGPFDTDNLPTVEKMKTADAAIVFVPGLAVDDLLDMLLAAEINVAWGSTGYEWNDEELDQRLKAKGLAWMRASNFSLGMNIVRRCLHMIGRGSDILDDPAYAIHEIHHAGKQDAPSGTALSWKAWLGKDAEITSERKGDVKGIHQLKMETMFESIELKHQALDRAVFAEGALWAVQQLMDTSTQPGFYTMETLFDKNMATNTLTK